MSRFRWPRLGLRREILILLPVTLLLLVLVAGFTLFAYRSAISLLTESRQREVAVQARQISVEIASGPWPTSAELRRAAPGAHHVAILDMQGQPIRSFGELASGSWSALIGEEPLTGATAKGPSADTGDMIIGLAPFEHQNQLWILRLDMPALELSRQRHGVRVLTWVVLPVSVALAVLALLFLPHFLRPYDSLMEQVKRVSPATTDEDDIASLVSTVERALATLIDTPESALDDDIGALQRTLGPNLESGLLLLDHQGRVLTLNSVGADLLEVDPVNRSSPLESCLASHPALLEMLRLALQEAQGLPRQEVRIDTSAGARSLGFTVHAIRRDDGAVRGHLVLFVDLTETQREAEARQIATSLEQLGELAAGMAHELRNSLATLRGYLTLIERHPEEESITDYLSEIRRESEHLQRVLEDFLTFAQPNTTRVETVDLLEIASRAATDPALDHFPVAVQASGSGPWRCQGDPQLLERALRNLLHNAARAERDVGSQGPIHLSLKLVDEQIEVWIEDRGPGIPREVRQRLFQPFVTSRSDGSGLGLSLTHRIVTLHRGRIRVEDRVDGGTQAILAFPIGVAVGPPGKNG